MGFIQPQMSTWFTHNKLQNATGDEFERYAHFFLLLLHKNYMKTRLKNDEGIDGYVLLRGECSTFNREIEYFSIYGPEAKTAWKDKKKKISDDLTAIRKDSLKNQLVIKKWYIVTNFDFIKSYDQEIAEMCESLEIEYELYYPQKMVGFLKIPEQVYQVSAFLGTVDIPDRKLTDFYYHIFAKKVLEILTNYQQRANTTEQLELINSLLQNIFFYIPQEEYFNQQSSKYNNISNLGTMLKKYTAIYSSEAVLIHEYDSEKMSFFTYNFDYAKRMGLIGEEIVGRNEKKNFFVRVNNLFVIYQILQNLKGQIAQKGKYSIKQALIMIYNWELRRKRHLQM